MVVLLFLLLLALPVVVPVALLGLALLAIVQAFPLVRASGSLRVAEVRLGIAVAVTQAMLVTHSRRSVIEGFDCIPASIYK